MSDSERPYNRILLTTLDTKLKVKKRKNESLLQLIQISSTQKMQKCT